MPQIALETTQCWWYRFWSLSSIVKTFFLNCVEVVLERQKLREAQRSKEEQRRLKEKQKSCSPTSQKVANANTTITSTTTRVSRKQKVAPSRCPCPCLRILWFSSLTDDVSLTKSMVLSRMGFFIFCNDDAVPAHCMECYHLYDIALSLFVMLIYNCSVTQAVWRTDCNNPSGWLFFK